jgi:DNA-binding beta-propeller fold protein YncE
MTVLCPARCEERAFERVSARAVVAVVLLSWSGLAAAQGIRVSHLAGPTVGGPGSNDGTGAAAAFYAPGGVVLDASGNAYVADTTSQTIRRVTPAGVVTTFAGRPGVVGSANGTGSDATFNAPTGIAIDGTGNLYVADTSNQTIRKITAAGVVTTLAGWPTFPGDADDIGTAARFRSPAGIAVDAAGSVAFVADTGNHTIRRIDRGTLSVTTLAGTALEPGTTDGTGAAARFNGPSAIATNGAGTAVFVGDTYNHTVRVIDVGTQAVITLAGLAGAPGGADGTGSAARFNQPFGISVDGAGALYVADTTNMAIRKVTVAGVVTTLAGYLGVRGTEDGTGTAARFYSPHGVAVDSGGTLAVVADTGNSTMRKVTAAGVVTTLAGAAAVLGSTDGVGSAARFNTPNGVAIDGAGIVYVADTSNSTIRKVVGQTVTTLAGKAGYYGTTDGSGTDARFWSPRGVTVTGDGTVFVADTYNDTIRRVTAAGVVTTLAGLAGEPDGSYADGTGTDARFYRPYGIAVDGSGILYVADTRNHVIRKVTQAGVVTTLAGLAHTPGTADGMGSAARFNAPYGISADPDGNVYVSDTGNHTIRKITADGTVTTIAGLASVAGDNDGTGSDARFRSPYGITVDDAGKTIYVSDFGNNTIREIRIDPYHTSTDEVIVSTLAGRSPMAGHVDGIGHRALFNGVWGVAVQGGQIYGAGVNSHNIRQLTRYTSADVDHDGLTDILVYRPPSGTWFALLSESNFTYYGYVGWGEQAHGDVPALGDYWGEGAVTPTVFRPESGTWFTSRLNDATEVIGWAWWGWGEATDTLVQGDYDGDGVTDSAVYRPLTGEWFIRPSAHTSWNVTFGETGDIPVPGDYDGDGKTDIAVYRPASGTWFVLTSSSGFTSWTYQGWGVDAEGDKPVPGDYDGDGKTDCAVYRPANGTWFILKSSADNMDWQWFGWGNSTDTLVPGDYDGDGITDAAVYRSTTGTWYVRPSSGASPWNVVFGESGDLPLSWIR